MPLSVLAGHHEGEAPAGVRLVSVKGVVFDVSGDIAFAKGGRLSRLPGHDASRLIALSAITEGSLCGEGEAEGSGAVGVGDELDVGLTGLRYEEHRRLETYFVEMARGRRAVAVLADEDHVR